MSLRKIREKIDRIDFELLNLLNERMELALRTKKLKPAVRDPEREERIVSRLKSRAEWSSLLSGEFVKELWGRILEESRRLQGRELRAHQVPGRARRLQGPTFRRRRRAASSGKSWKR
jgi:chorismate mutase